MAKEEIKKKTVGQVATELKQNATREFINPQEIQQEVQKGFEDHIWECVDNHKKQFDGDFYVVVITKKERLLDNVLRNYFIGRESCPTPDYDQTVYRYIKNDDRVKFMWVIPSKAAVDMLYAHQDEVVEEEQWLLDYVKRFKSGFLTLFSKEENGERADSNILKTTDNATVKENMKDCVAAPNLILPS